MINGVIGTTTTGISTSRETGDSIGSAAIGQTSTYSSHTLRHGDAVGSVIDHTSRDPTTYKMPEHTFGQGTSATGEKSSSGVPAGAAGTAASLAFNKHQEQSSMLQTVPSLGYANRYIFSSRYPGLFPQRNCTR